MKPQKYMKCWCLSTCNYTGVVKFTHNYSVVVWYCKHPGKFLTPGKWAAMFCFFVFVLAKITVNTWKLCLIRSVQLSIATVYYKTMYFQHLTSTYPTIFTLIELQKHCGAFSIMCLAIRCPLLASSFLLPLQQNLKALFKTAFRAWKLNAQTIMRQRNTPDTLWFLWGKYFVVFEPGCCQWLCPTFSSAVCGLYRVWRVPRSLNTCMVLFLV